MSRQGNTAGIWTGRGTAERQLGKVTAQESRGQYQADQVCQKAEFYRKENKSKLSA